MAQAQYGAAQVALLQRIADGNDDILTALNGLRADNAALLGRLKKRAA